MSAPAAAPTVASADMPGDQVYANLLDHGYGGFAEYAVNHINTLARVPDTMSDAADRVVALAGGR